MLSTLHIYPHLTLMTILGDGQLHHYFKTEETDSKIIELEVNRKLGAYLLGAYYVPGIVHVDNTSSFFLSS